VTALLASDIGGNVKLKVEAKVGEGWGRKASSKNYKNASLILCKELSLNIPHREER
jgi:hypothetical protein